MSFVFFQSSPFHFHLVFTTRFLACPNCFPILVIQVSEYQNGLFLNSEEVPTNFPMPLCTPGQSPIKDFALPQSPLPKLPSTITFPLFICCNKTGRGVVLASLSITSLRHSRILPNCLCLSLLPFQQLSGSKISPVRHQAFLNPFLRPG